MYIKTENWHGDDELDNRHGYRKGRDGDIHNRPRGGDRRGDYKKGHDGYKKGGEYKKGRDGYKHGPSAPKKPYIDPAKLAGLSYEERMKLYKDAYASGRPEQKKGDGYKKSGYNKNYSGNKKTGNYNKNNGYKKGSYQKNAGNKPAAPAPKKTFWQKVKAFFGR